MRKMARTARPATDAATTQPLSDDVPSQRPVQGHASASSNPEGKIGTIIAMLREPGGATIEALMAATGWQAHSVRGALSGSVRKRAGLPLLSQKTATGRVYSLADQGAA